MVWVWDIGTCSEAEYGHTLCRTIHIDYSLLQRQTTTKHAKSSLRNPPSPIHLPAQVRHPRFRAKTSKSHTSSTPAKTQVLQNSISADAERELRHSLDSHVSTDKEAGADGDIEKYHRTVSDTAPTTTTSEQVYNTCIRM